MKEYIKSDLCRYVGPDHINAKTFIRHYIFNKGFKFSFWFRLTRSKNPVIRFIAKLQHRHLSVKYFLQIPRSVEIGYGLYIGHGQCVVMHPSAKLGNNVNISQFLTIGSNDGKAAEIGDCVYIGPNVSVVEHVTIGAHAIIGAGAVVTKDIPAYSVAVGNPARVIKTTKDNQYSKNRYTRS